MLHHLCPLPILKTFCCLTHLDSDFCVLMSCFTNDRFIYDEWYVFWCKTIFTSLNIEYELNIAIKLIINNNIFLINNNFFFIIQSLSSSIFTIIFIINYSSLINLIIINKIIITIFSVYLLTFSYFCSIYIDKRVFVCRYYDKRYVVIMLS